MKPIPGHAGYFATDEGEIASDRSGAIRLLKSRIWKGYRIVTMSAARARHRLPVHRLVTLAYRGLPIDEGQEARHLNGCSLDNRPGNLVWGTRLENVADAIRHGTIGPGMRARRRKLSDVQVVEIRRRYQAGEQAVTLEDEFKISAGYAAKLAKGQRWSCLRG
jgi:hypothetical protein